jgi:hypothetical protein
MTRLMRSRLAPAALAALLAVGLAGCADDDTPAAGTDGDWTAFTATELRVTHRPDGTAAGERTLTVTCPEEPADADTDCRELLELARGDVFDAAMPPGTVCTQIFGGPQTVTVVGVLAGANVTTTFTRVDGCQIARWDRAVPLLLRMGRP